MSTSRSGAVESSRDMSRNATADRSRTITSRSPSSSEGIDRIREATRDRIGVRKADSVRDRAESPVERNERVRSAGPELRERTSLEPRLQRSIGHRPDRVVQRDLGGIHREHTVRPRVVYRDRPDLVRHEPRHVHVYRDHYDRLCHRIIWPRYHYPIYYDWGPYHGYHWVYPYYHRKYVFISLGGWWPWDYDYVRYYWYGYHPYVWMGYYPIPREVEGDTYNYYTYNYYTGDGGYPTQTTQTSSGGLPYGIDAETYARVQQRVREQQAKEPGAPTQADTRFEEGVTRFEAGNYAEAAQAFASAMSMAPNDMILPFAYAQALFANGQYSEAAEALRAALKNASPEQEGVFYPRGLYAQDEVLFGQLEKLLDKVDAYGFDADLQLLLGYHLLGVGEMEYARGPLEQAGQDIRNAQAAKVLLNVLNKQEAAGTTGGAAGSQGVSGAGAVTPDAAAPATSSKSNVLERVKGSASEDANQQAPVEKTTPNLDPNTHYGQMVPVNAGRQESPAKEEDDVPSPR
ncbi:MAG: tetratricopeptide repeat protein [Phycisphaerae bacterium]|nr:tetratricopeptide repeat protein [Phycisphaerae bacterium]